MPYKTSIILSEKQIRSIFLTHFPDSRLLSIEELSQSFINPVFSLSTSNSEEYILKINNPHWSNKQKRELKAMDVAREKTTIPIPRVFAASFEKTIIPFDYMIQEKLPGIELRAAINSSAFSETDLQVIIEQLGTHLGELHSIKFDFFGDFTMSSSIDHDNIQSKKSPFWNNRFVDWPSCFRAFCYDNLNWVDTTSFPQYRKQLVEKIEYFSEKVSCIDSACFVHSDIQPTNILIHGNQITGLIDFEWSFAGSADFEFALVLAGLYFSSFPSVNHSELFKSFTPQKDALIKECFTRGYQKFSKRSIIDEPLDLMDFIWLLYMIGSWSWTTKSSTSEEILALEKSVHRLFKQFVA